MGGIICFFVFGDSVVSYVFILLVSFVDISFDRRFLRGFVEWVSYRFLEFFGLVG